MLAVQPAELERIVAQYFEAMEQRDLQACLSFYDENARINFTIGIYEGRKAVESWHQDRFQANLKIVSIERIVAAGDSVTVQATITSDRIKKWRLNTLSGKAVFQFVNGKIKETKVDLVLSNPLEAWE
jgi:hypothetical protein